MLEKKRPLSLHSFLLSSTLLVKPPPETDGEGGGKKREEESNRWRGLRDRDKMMETARERQEWGGGDTLTDQIIAGFM